MDTKEAFFEAGDVALAVVASELVASNWEAPSALEGLSVGGIVAHLYSAVRLFENALRKPEPVDAEVSGFREFYSLNRMDDGEDFEDPFQVAIRSDATRRADEGPAALAARFSDLVARLRDELAELPLDRLVPVWRIEGGATTLDDYLRTRIVELLVHADDLAASVGIELALPPMAASAALLACLELARARVGDLAVLRAFTRRERAEPDVLRVL